MCCRRVAAVLAGSLLDVEPLVDAGGGLLVVVLALVAHRVRGTTGPARRLLSAYRLLVAALFTSIPTGHLLARAGAT